MKCSQELSAPSLQLVRYLKLFRFRKEELKPHPFLIILLHFTIIYALEAIYVYCVSLGNTI